MCVHSNDSGTFFELPVLVALTVRDTVVPTPVVSSPMVIMNNDKEHVPQDPIETDATDEGE
jgi:ABC-type transporter lipoprotein component MlaA